MLLNCVIEGSLFYDRKGEFKLIVQMTVVWIIQFENINYGKVDFSNVRLNNFSIF